MTGCEMAQFDFSDLNGKTAVVTGGSSGIGLAITKALLDCRCECCDASAETVKRQRKRSQHWMRNVAGIELSCGVVPMLSTGSH
jgi:NAD(P)-dependent dehydrogenase (short-subunit alcohol dehydrogenase family)